MNMQVVCKHIVATYFAIFPEAAEALERAADEDYDEDYDEDNIFVECICPNCKATFYVKEDELDDDVFHICPRCEARVHVVPDYEDDEEIPVAHLADETPDEDK